MGERRKSAPPAVADELKADYAEAEAALGKLGLGSELVLAIHEPSGAFVNLFDGRPTERMMTPAGPVPVALRVTALHIATGEIALKRDPREFRLVVTDEERAAAAEARADALRVKRADLMRQVDEIDAELGRRE